MEKNDLIRIKHMLDASLAACEFLYNKEKKELKENLLLSSAIVRQLEILGEAAANVSFDFRRKYPEVPWQKIVGMRNRLIHAYFNVNPEIVWTAVTVEVPKIIPCLQSIIDESES